MMSLITSNAGALLALLATVGGFIAAFLRRGQKIKALKNQQAAKEEVDATIDRMGDAVPKSFHIDRLLAQRSDVAKSAASKGGGKGGLP